MSRDKCEVAAETIRKHIEYRPDTPGPRPDKNEASAALAVLVAEIVKLRRRVLGDE